MDDSLRKLIFDAIDGTISAADFDRLQHAIEHQSEVRQEYLAAVSLCENLHELALQRLDTHTATPSEDAGLPESAPTDAAPPADSTGSLRTSAVRPRGGHRLLLLAGVALASAVAVVAVAVTSFRYGQQASPVASGAAGTTQTPDRTEPVIAGHATLRRTVDLKWSDPSSTHREGDVLPDGLLQFEAGVAEIDFFCGATLIVEGPATLDVESDWSVRVLRGRLRASVPPAARGFVVRAAGSDIVDLGTEFAVEVGTASAQVQVLDGEVEVRGGPHDGSHLITGQRRWLKGQNAGEARMAELGMLDDLVDRRRDAESRRFATWREDAQRSAADSRLIAYYPIAAGQSGRLVPNSAASGSLADGTLIGPVNQTTGRFGSLSAGLEFERPGSRVRTRIDGQFQAFTFSCWARIDSLEHRYNALFMADGYENGEPHWQIRDDGRLMFSVMVDDTHHVPRFDKTDRRVIRTAGRHHIYFTDSIWDITKSGQWFHLAAVYDPTSRRVEQYVDGTLVSTESIHDSNLVRDLRIGPAEIGNWGQPLRRTPWFAVRNLNGTIDELAIFNAALSANEIRQLYEQGKPLGY